MSDDTFAIHRLIVYPIKSCKGIDLGSSACTPDGLLYDRQWMIVDAVSFKAMTARRYPRMVLIEPTLDPASNALRVLLPPFEKKTTVSAAWSWHIPLRTEVELNRPSFELPLELDEAQRREWERLSCLDLWGLTLSGLSPPSTHCSNRILSEFFGRPTRIVVKDPDGKRAPGKKAIEAGPTGYGEATTAFADTYALHLVTLPALESFSAAIARSGISSEIRYRPSARDDSGSSSARAFATPVEQHLDASSSTSSPPTGVLGASWSTLLSYVTPSAPLAILATSPLGPTTPAEPRLFDRSPEGLIHRFRPNVVLAPISTQAPVLANKEWPHEHVYPEDDWGALTIGSEDADESVDRWDMHVVGRCGRCTLPNVDPETGVRHPTLPHKILGIVRPKEVDEYVGVPCPTLGVYAVPIRRPTAADGAAKLDGAHTREAGLGQAGRWAIGDLLTVRSRRIDEDAEQAAS